ncbi:hypothetical protein H2201_009009, partial [Coniosporium apollinis]
MCEFRKTIHYVIARAQQQAEDLLFSWWPEVKLELIRDNLATHRPGYSFLADPVNQLQNSFRVLSRRAFSKEIGFSVRGAGRGKAIDYLRGRDRLVQFLYAAIHLTSGMPARGEELRMIRWADTTVVARNIFIYQGQIILVFSYNKANTNHNNSFYIVLGGGWSDYVWADARGPWETERLTRVMTRETEARIGNRLTTHDYRHAAVGIGRVVVGESFARGYQDEVGEIEEPEVEEDESPLELQNARTTVIGTGHYGVPVDIIKHLSVRSLETFRPLSELWHRFLGLASGQEKMKEVKSRDSGMGWERAMTGPPCRKRGVGPLSEREAKELALPKKRTEGQEGHDRKEDVRRAMQQVLGSAEVSFRSIEQEQAMYAVMAGQTPLVVVLPTGGGKSLLFMVPACLDEPGVTVVVVPYRALVEDLVDRLKRARIDCLEWKPGEVNPAAVVVVSADIAASWGFLNYASLLGRQGLLRRVVIDECHLTFTASDWRPKLAQLRHLRVLACPIVLLTATLPPVLEEELSESMLVRCATYIRASTVRPNIRKEQCEDVAAELDCAYYHAGVVDRAERLEGWLERGGFIVATSALGTGVDFPGIVFVLHVGMPWAMIDFAQESGRAGRGGEAVDSVILVEEGEDERRAAKDGGSSIDVWAMAAFIQADSCRRGVMSRYLDGKEVVCTDLGEGAAACDRCGEGLTEWQISQSEAAEEWRRVREAMDELADLCP